MINLILLFCLFCGKQEGLAAQEKVDELTKEVKALREENKSLSDNYNSERVSTVAQEFVLVAKRTSNQQITYLMTLTTS